MSNCGRVSSPFSHVVELTGAKTDNLHIYTQLQHFQIRFGLLMGNQEALLCSRAAVGEFQLSLSNACDIENHDPQRRIRKGSPSFATEARCRPPALSKRLFIHDPMCQKGSSRCLLPARARPERINPSRTMGVSCFFPEREVNASAVACGRTFRVQPGGI